MQVTIIHTLTHQHEYQPIQRKQFRESHRATLCHIARVLSKDLQLFFQIVFGSKTKDTNFVLLNSTEPLRSTSTYSLFSRTLIYWVLFTLTYLNELFALHILLKVDKFTFFCKQNIEVKTWNLINTSESQHSQTKLVSVKCEIASRS